jgi:hypothetical protein
MIKLILVEKSVIDRIWWSVWISVMNSVGYSVLEYNREIGRK